MNRTDLEKTFSDPATVDNYADATLARVPGFTDMHRMALLLLSENAPKAAHILVLGAGGGLELRAFAQARPDWQFVGVDPSQPMLDQAHRILGSLNSQARLLKGYAEDAPEGPYDGASCLLTLHFLNRPERLRVLQSLRARMKCGAALVVVHHSKPPQGSAERWLKRSALFAAATQGDARQAEASALNMAQNLPLLSSIEEEDLLREAGFFDVDLFYAGFSFRGWVARA